MGVKIFRNGAWEEITEQHEDDFKRKAHFNDKANAFVEVGTGFSINFIQYSLSNHKRMLAGAVEFQTNSSLRVNSKYYLGYLFPQFGYYLPIINSIYHCGISLYGSAQTFFPAAIWSDLYNEDERKLTIAPFFAVAASNESKATIKVDFIYNLGAELSNDYVDVLFNN